MIFKKNQAVLSLCTEGTGLGMYIARKVAEAHKGRIWAESDGRGKGSRFILELPMA